MSNKTKHQRKRYAAEHKFAKLLALDGIIAQGGEFAKDGRKAKRRMADHWGKRNSTNVQGVYKAHNAKPGACVTIQA